jgi:hypothetical protein
MTLHRVLSIAVACSFSALQIAGAQRSARGPDDVVRAVLRADSVGDWRSMLALAHPDAIAEFREAQVRGLSFDGSEFPGVQPLSQCMKDQIAQSRRVQLDSIYQVSSVDALAKLTADTVFARHRRWQAHFPRTPPEDTLMPRPRYAYLGHLMADDSTAYGILSGHVRTGSVQVLSSTHPSLTHTVLEAPRTMTFDAARVGGIAVPQVVQQPFTFSLVSR